MKIISIVGARPNFMKIAPFIAAIIKYREKSPIEIEHILVHTGQHYDDRMSEKFFKELNIPNADINLGIGSGTHAEQVGKTMIEFEKVLLKEKPDWVVVVGDVNATLACSVTAKKLHINVCHIEAGLRSKDMTMPEEINRLVTDRLSDLLLTPDRLSSQNLLNEGIASHKIKMVGNIMIDTLEEHLSKASQISVKEIIKRNSLYGNTITKFPEKFGTITMHRPSNVDNPTILEHIITFFTNDVSVNFPVIWPIHPRTEKNLKKFNLWDQLIETKNIYLLHPIGYLEMLKLNSESEFLITDSGGLQEESCVLGTPCLTMRFNTERPITLREHGGLSVLVGNNIKKLKQEFHKIQKQIRKPSRPELWDGKTADRCLEAIINYK